MDRGEGSRLFLARRNRIVEARGYGLRVHKGDSTELEWLGKAVLLRTTCHLKGKKVLVADSAAGAFRGSKIPKWGTWLEAYARGALDKVDLGTYVEGWVRAQHDSGMKDFLAQCNKMADDKATEEIQKQCVEGLFVPASDLEGPVFHVQGAVVLGVSASLDSIYEESIHQRAQLGITGFDPRWNARGGSDF